MTNGMTTNIQNIIIGIGYIFYYRPADLSFFAKFCELMCVFRGSQKGDPRSCGFPLISNPLNWPHVGKLIAEVASKVGRVNNIILH